VENRIQLASASFGNIGSMVSLPFLISDAANMEAARECQRRPLRGVWDPTLILEGDNIDERNYADDQVKSRIEDFISLMMV
jgi:hypothetical protein